MNDKFFAEFKKLIELQKIDDEITSLVEQLETIPIEIDKLNQYIQQIQHSIEENKNSIKQIQVSLKQKELDVQTIESQINKHNSELNVVKTNEQYKALLNEIQRLKSEKDKIETEILELLSTQDELLQKIKLSDTELNTKKSDIEKQISDLKKKQQDLEQQKNAKETERQTLAQQIENQYLSTYERIKTNRDNVALSAVRDKSCSVCNMKLTQQEINEVSKYEEFIFCESCSRILYIPQDFEK